MRFWTTLLSFSLPLLTFVSAFPNHHFVRLASRDTPPSDPCCKTCYLVGAIPFNATACPPSGDIFCGCDELVDTGPACRGCIDSALAHGYNTTYASLLSLMEYFYSWCQCKHKCRALADSLFGATCGFGQNETCVLTSLVDDGPCCLGCVCKIDEWFAGTLEFYIQAAQTQLQNGGPYGFVPGTFLNFLS